MIDTRKITDKAREILATLDDNNRATQGHPSTLAALGRLGILQRRHTFGGTPITGPQGWEATDAAVREGIVMAPLTVHHTDNPDVGTTTTCGEPVTIETVRTSDDTRVTCEDCADHLTIERAKQGYTDDQLTNVVAYNGGKVHTSPTANNPNHLPLCRQSPGQRNWTQFRTTTAPVDCAHCLAFFDRRATAYANAEQARQRITNRAAKANEPKPVIRTRAAIPALRADDVDMIRASETLAAAGYTPVTVVHEGDDDTRWTYQGCGYAITAAPGNRIMVVSVVDGAIDHTTATATVKSWARILPTAGYVIREHYNDAVVIDRPQRSTRPDPTTNEDVREILQRENGSVPDAITHNGHTFRPGDTVTTSGDLTGTLADLIWHQGEWFATVPTSEGETLTPVRLLRHTTRPEPENEDIPTTYAVSLDHVNDGALWDVAECLADYGAKPVRVAHSNAGLWYYDGDGFAVTRADSAHVRVTSIANGDTAPDDEDQTFRWALTLQAAGYSVTDFNGNTLTLLLPYTGEVVPLPYRTHPRPDRITRAHHTPRSDS